MNDRIRTSVDGSEILFLSRNDILASDITPSAMADAVEKAFREKSLGRATVGPSLNFPIRQGAKFSAKGGVLTGLNYAALKWYGVVANNAQHDLPEFHPMLLLNTADTGMPLAILDGRWITEVRTAAISIVAARMLAKPSASRIGFIGCGAQADSHLDAFSAQFPLAQVTTYSRRIESAERLAQRARRRGLHAEATHDPELAIREQDIIISTVPRHAESTQFLNVGDVAPSTFIAMVDMGFAWNSASISKVGYLITDDLEKGKRRSAESLNYSGDFAADISEMLGDPCFRPPDDASTRALIFAGSGLADVAAAGLVYERALAKKLGQRLKL